MLSREALRLLPRIRLLFIFCLNYLLWDCIVRLTLKCKLPCLVFFCSYDLLYGLSPVPTLPSVSVEWAPSYAEQMYGV